MTERLAGELPNLVGTETRISGVSDRLTRELDFGERVIVIVDATVVNVGVKGTASGPILSRALKVNDLFELEGDHGEAVIRALRGQRRQTEDANLAHDVLPGLAGVTDGAGVVMTPGDLAERLETETAAHEAGGGRADYAEALEWAERHFHTILDTGPDFTEGDPAVTTLADAIAADFPDAPLRVYRYIGVIEELNNGQRAPVNAVLEELEAARVGEWSTIPPWDGYDVQPVAAVIEELLERETTLGVRTFNDLVERVGIYEEAHKDRKRIRQAVVDYTVAEPVIDPDDHPVSDEDLERAEDAPPEPGGTVETTDGPPLPGEDGE